MARKRMPTSPFQLLALARRLAEYTRSTRYQNSRSSACHGSGYSAHRRPSAQKLQVPRNTLPFPPFEQSKRRTPPLPPERFRRSSAKQSSEDQRRRKRGLLPEAHPTRRTGCRRKSVPASNRRQRSLPWHPPRHAASPWRDSPHARSNSPAPARREAPRPSDAPRRAP